MAIVIIAMMREVVTEVPAVPDAGKLAKAWREVIFAPLL